MQRLLLILQGQLFFAPHRLRHLQEARGTESGGSVAGGTESGGGVAGGTESGKGVAGGMESGGSVAGGTESGGCAAGGTESGEGVAGGTKSGGGVSGGTESGGVWQEGQSLRCSTASAVSYCTAVPILCHPLLVRAGVFPC